MIKNVKLITDSTSDLSKELIEELDLDILPLYISFEGEDKAYKDGEEITAKEAIEHVKQTGKLPQTSCVSPGTFLEKFNEYTDKGIHVIFIGISSKLSGNYQSANLAKNDSKHPELITIIESDNLSSAIGLCLLKARDFINEGFTPEEAKEKIEKDIVPYIHTSFCMNNVDYMVKGGRCSMLTGFFAKILSMKPIISVKKGKLVLSRTPIGSLNSAIKNIHTELMKEIDNCELDYIMVTHFFSDECMNYITPIVEETCNFKHVYVTCAGTTIGSHCGPGTIGLLYITKPPKKD